MNEFYWDAKRQMFQYKKEPVIIKEEPKKLEEKNNFLFVYGTLRFHNKHLLKGAELVKKNTSAINDYYMYIHKHLPIMIRYPGGGGAKVVGEIYKVTDEMLKEIDAFKLKPGIYERRIINVGWDAEFRCWTYMFPKDNPRFIDDEWKYDPALNGDYGQYLKSLVNEEELLGD